MRAANLQDLVYKSGQAGITKASVSITFDNRDKNQSPMGYEQYDEIIVTRQVHCKNDILGVIKLTDLHLIVNTNVKKT